MRESEAGGQIVVGKEFQRNDAAEFAEMKDRLPVSSLTDG